jgi:hypothetical protein
MTILELFIYHNFFMEQETSKKSIKEYNKRIEKKYWSIK